MLKKIIKATNVLFLASLINACNHIEANQSIIPAKHNPIFSFIIIVPIISVMLIILSYWKNLAFKISLQRYLHIALILMLTLAWVTELNLADNLSRTLNSNIIIISSLFQVLLTTGAYLSLKKQQVKDKKQRYFL